MLIMKLPKQLTDKITYMYKTLHYRNLHDWNFKEFEILNFNLRNDIKLYVNKIMIETTPFMKYLNHNEVIEVINKFHRQ